MNWVVRRIINLILTIIISVSVTFFLVRIMPGNPIDTLIQQYMMQGYSYKEALTAVRALISYMPNEPLHIQYFNYWKAILRGDLGRSITLATPVSQILGFAVPWTVFIVSISLLSSFAVGVLLGVYAAYKRGSLFDHSISLFASISRSIPHYIIGVVFVVFLAVQLRLFPAYGAYGRGVTPGFNIQFIGSVLYHAALPVITYVVTTFGGWMLSMKSNTISVLGEYYVVAARARGLPNRRISLTYVGRNAILPLFTRFAISIGYMFGGVVFVETIFSYPGIGSYLSYAIGVRDWTLMTGCFLLITIAVVVSNFVADLLYSRLDPRIRFTAK